MNLVDVGVRALRRVGLLDHITITVPVNIAGHSTRVPLVNGMGLMNVLEFEPFMDELILRLAPMFPGVFLDVGVNVGQTLIKAKNLYPGLEYIGFEPNPVCVSYAERLVRANRYGKVTLIPAGLTDQDGEGTLTLRTGSAFDPTATLIADFRERQAEQLEVKVPLTRWTTAEERFRIGKLGFVKIDVEGSEVFVLRELGDRLRKDRPVVAVEVLPTHDPPIADRLGRQKEIERIVQQNDMVIHRVHKELKGVRLERLSEFGIHSDLAWIDHLLVPNEREAEVMKAFEH